MLSVWLRILQVTSIALSSFSLFASHPVVAQITPDSTLGDESSRVRTGAIVRGGSADLIEGGATRGRNLFHSFGEFNIDNGQRVYFANPSGIENILGRVTGTDVSDILGTLGVAGNANLFLLNPNGFIFGPSARLDIRGSLTVGTGDRFSLGNGRFFSATNPQAPPLLTVNAPIGLQYGTGRGLAATIENQGRLVVGRNLSLRGGFLDLQGVLRAGGNLDLRAQNNLQLRATPTQPFVAVSGGDMRLQGNTAINILVSPNSPLPHLISAGNLTLLSNGVIATDARLSSGSNFAITTLAGQPAYWISRQNASINVNGDYQVGNYQGPSLQVNAGGDVRYGTVLIDTIDPAINPNYPVFALNAGGRITTGGISSTVPNLMVSLVSGGDIRVQDITTRGGPINLMSRAGSITATGEMRSGSIVDENFNPVEEFAGGAIALSAANNIQINNLSTASISVFNNSANGGAIALFAGDTINTRTVEALTFSILGNSGTGGTIAFSAGDTIRTRGDITSSSKSFFATSGNGGAIALSATRNNILATARLDVATSSESGNTGNGGAIALTAGNNITTNTVTTLSSSPLGNSGQGGTITLVAGHNIVGNSPFDSRSVGNAGRGGNISLAAGNNILADSLLAYSFSTGRDSDRGGAIDVSAGSRISTGDLSAYSIAPREGNSGRGGTIDVSAGIRIFTGDLSAYSRVIEGTSQNGGAINLSAGGQIRTGRISTISLAEMGESGRGGRITLDAGQRVEVGTVSWGASTANRNNGALQVDTPGQVEFTGSLLPQNADIIIGREANPNSVILPTAILTNGGDFDLVTSGNINFRDTDIITSQLNGRSGSIAIRTVGTLRLNGSRLFTSVEPGSAGSGGDITLDVGGLSLNNFSLIDTATYAAGRAGNLRINVQGSIRLNQSDISSITAGSGDAGSITLRAGDALLLSNLSTVSTAARANSRGNGGTITVQSERVSLTGGSQLQAFTQGIGNSGNIDIQAENLRVSGRNTNRIRSGIFTSSDGAGSGEGGSITVTSPGIVQIDGGGVLSAQTLSRNPGGDIQVNAGWVRLLNGGQILSSSEAGGEAGNITLTATEGIDIQNTSPTLQEPNLPLFDCQVITGAACSNQANANVEFSTRLPYVTLTGEQSTQGDEYRLNIPVPGTRVVFDIDGGGNAIFEGEQRIGLTGTDTDITLLNAEGQRLASNDDADVSLGGSGSDADITTNGTENIPDLPTGQDAYLRYTFREAGTYRVRVGRDDGNGLREPPYSLNISVEAPATAGRTINATNTSGLFARSSGNGVAGNISVMAPQLRVFSQGEITVSSVQSRAGSIMITSPASNTLTQVLLNGGQLTAATAASPNNGDGANIMLQGFDLVLMENNSLISAQASAQANGGNVDIDLENGYVIGLPFENNDIIATADQGDGGEITIAANGIFGFTNQTDTGLSTDALRANGISDISASSRFGNPGTINLDLLNTDLRPGLTELPTNVVDASRLIARRCGAGRTLITETLGQFSITGRDGLPYRPGEGVRSPFTTGSVRSTSPTAQAPPTPSDTPDKQWRSRDFTESESDELQGRVYPCS